MLDREPGGKAQLAAAIAAVIVYLGQRVLGLLPVELDLLAPLAAYAACQVAGWVWARRRTTPVDSPSLPEGTDVTLPDGTAGEVSRK